MNLRIVAFYLGRVSLGLAFVLAIPVVTSLYHGELEGMAFVLAMLLAVVIGLRLKRWGLSDTSQIDELTLQESLAITGLTWFLAAIIGMMPFAISGDLNIIDSFFESLSGFTGMGGTVFRDLSRLSRTLIFWRSLTQWLGGLGIIVIFVALLPQTSHSALELYQAETSRLSSGRRRPRLRETALAMLKVYSLLTFSAMLAFFLAGMDFFDAICHALTTLAAGGFSPYDASIAYFHSPVIEAIVTFFMILAGGNFNLYYSAWRDGVTVLWRDVEFRTYLVMLLSASFFIATVLVLKSDYNFFTAFGMASFEAAAQNSTGFIAYDYELWPTVTHCVFVFLMISGGCAGSTTAGLKVSRLIILFKMAHASILQAIYPHRQVKPHLNGQPLDRDIMYQVGRFFSFYVLLMSLWSALYMLDGTDFFDAFSLSLATMTVVGPSFGTIGATENYANLSDWGKIVTCFSMLAGRLEIFTLFALLSPSFWRRTRGW